jgi:ADP-heptose:LPS heptosyltransferase
MARHFNLHGDWTTFRDGLVNGKVPQLLLIPHQTLTEALVFLPHLLNLPKDAWSIKVIYRPFSSKSMEKFIHKSRERFGVRLLSRKNGLVEAAHAVKNGECVGVLFDQDAGQSGLWMILCGRVASTTPLPEVLCKGVQVNVLAVYTRRRGFLRASFENEVLDGGGSGVSHSMNAWLENMLQNDSLFRSDWLWSHRRWKRSEREVLNLRVAKSQLVESCRCHGWVELPKNFRIFIRMANWLGDIVMAIPIIRAIRRSRPDAHITVLCRQIYAKWLQSLPWIDSVRVLPEKGFGYFRGIVRLRKQLPDLHILFTNSPRGDLEAWLIGAPMRIGLLRSPLGKRLLLTHRTLLGHGERKTAHQTHRWYQFLRKFGLDEGLDLSPIGTHAPVENELVIGFSFGKNNNSAKCWPTAHWEQLAHLICERHSHARIVLFGTEKDMDEADEICNRLEKSRFLNFTGKTSLGTFARLLKKCSALVSIDSGGMHLANGLGIPVVALFGPTDYRLSGPIYDAKTICITSPSREMSSIRPSSVLEKLGQILEKN